MANAVLVIDTVRGFTFKECPLYCGDRASYPNLGRFKFQAEDL